MPVGTGWNLSPCEFKNYQHLNDFLMIIFVYTVFSCMAILPTLSVMFCDTRSGRLKSIQQRSMEAQALAFDDCCT